MVVGRVGRREQRRARVATVIGGAGLDAALDLLELLELAWHDSYGEVTPPDDVIDDILVLSEGSLAGLIAAAHLAVTDWRDARIAADGLRR